MRVASKSLVLTAAFLIFLYELYIFSAMYQTALLKADAQRSSKFITDAGTITNSSLIPSFSTAHLRTEIQGFVRNNTSPQVCIVSRTYEKQYSYLLTHLLSISHNPVAMPRVLFVITDENSKPEPVIELIRAANSLTGYDMAHLLPITPQIAQNISADYKTDYGYSYTDAAIEYLLQHSKEYPCDYLIFTNGDNLYSTGFADDYILPDIKEGVQIIGFNFITRYTSNHGCGSTGEDYLVDDTTRHEVPSQFKTSLIDLGAFVIDMTIIAAHPELRFVKLCDARGGKKSESDGYFVEHGASLAIKKRIHRQVLMVHQ